MIKRSPNSAPEENLPVTTNDGSLMKTLRKPSKQNRRRSPRKQTLWFRIFGWAMLIIVLSLYVIGTRHVILLTSSGTYSGGETISNAPYPRTGIDNRDGNEPKLTGSLSEKPRSLGYYFALTDSDSFVGTERLDPNMKLFYDNSKRRITREVFMTAEEVSRQEYLLDSKSYDSSRRDTMKKQGKDCVPQYDWQEGFYPTCNLVMEVDHSNLNYMPMFHEDHYNNKHDLPLASEALHSYSKLIANGGWRDVWRVENLLRHEGKQEETFILKTMRYGIDVDERNLDRHRRDAVTYEKLTFSDFIMDIYGFCGNSGLFEYAGGGDLSESIWYNYHLPDDSEEKPWTSEEKMVLAYQTASGLADLHNFAKEGVPAVVHADIAGNQYVYVEEAGAYKLNDFNRGRFLGINSKTHELCNFTVGLNNGPDRSPEEYAYHRQTEKIDVYSLGNIFFGLLTGKQLFYDEDKHNDKAIMKYVKQGKRSSIPEKYKNSDDPFEQTLLNAIEMCWKQDPKERTTARALQKLFENELEKQGVKKSEW